MIMADTIHEEALAPDLCHLITEDDNPVDNRFSERQFKLLTHCLLESWNEGKPFEALSDVGLFYRPDNGSRVVPDFLLALGVLPRPVTKAKEDLCYCTWHYGKAPDLVVEIVSNKEGGELTSKLEIYETIRVAYYAVYDPFLQLGRQPLRLFQLVGRRYVEMKDPLGITELGLGFTLWEGSFLDVKATWLRFVDREGSLIPTAREGALETRRELERILHSADEAQRQAEEARRQAAEARKEVERERLRAERERLRAEKLEAKLREFGHE